MRGSVLIMGFGGGTVALFFFSQIAGSVALADCSTIADNGWRAECEEMQAGARDGFGLLAILPIVLVAVLVSVVLAARTTGPAGSEDDNDMKNGPPEAGPDTHWEPPPELHKFNKPEELR